MSTPAAYLVFPALRSIDRVDMITALAVFAMGAAMLAAAAWIFTMYQRGRS